MDFRAYIFDLDGTLLDTLPDLVNLTNKTLTQYGWPTRTSDEVLSFVGDGGRMLLKRAAPVGTSDQEIEEAFQYWEEIYPTYGHKDTKPYEGIPEVLTNLKEQDVKLAVLSNKFDAATKEVIDAQFPNTFDVVRGERPDTPRKPNPTGLKDVLSILGVSAQNAIYIGDSPTDQEVARLAGTFSASVLWGYHPREDLEPLASVLLHKPFEILSL